MVTYTTIHLSRLRSLVHTGAAKSIRIGAGVSLPEMGRDVGVSHSTIYRWENGMNVPKGDQALRYLTLLDALSGVAP